jgi:hypothetical protein
MAQSQQEEKMKSKLALLGFLVVLATVSCASMKGREMAMSDYDIQYDRDKNIEGLTIEVTNIVWGNNWMYDTEGIEGISITVKNGTDGILKILWEESSVSYSQKSFPVFLDGMKYANAGQVNAPPTIVGKGQSASRDVFSADQPFFVSGRYGGWRMGFMDKDVLLVICVAKADAKVYETINIKANLKPIVKKQKK